MLKTIMTEADVLKGLRLVRERIQIACQKRPPEYHKIEPQLVAVSKTKPIELIITAYKNGQRDFGENYVQEIVEKGNNPKLIGECPDIQWHFIGHLQRNKVNKIIGVPGLHMIETVDTEKLASALDSAWGKQNKDYKLKVMVQVNTSAEEEKSGCEPDEALQLVKHVLESCNNLQLMGLMTIGKYDYDLSLGPNPDFICLKNVRDKISKELDTQELALSMGMSTDYEHAIEVGSTYVRVGSSIFGQREKKLDSSVKEVTEGVQKVAV